MQRQPRAELEHFEFLAAGDRDPRPAFLASLCEVLGQSGHIVVYNRPFESERLADLARWLPEFEGPIRSIQSRLWDLLTVVRAHVYHPLFMGSFSLKSVLPALLPYMTYEGMEVAEGAQAGLAWDKMVRGQIDDAERLREVLLAYCKQDALALARLLNSLQAGCGVSD